MMRLYDVELLEVDDIHRDLRMYGLQFRWKKTRNSKNCTTLYFVTSMPLGVSLGKCYLMNNGSPAKDDVRK